MGPTPEWSNFSVKDKFCAQTDRFNRQLNKGIKSYDQFSGVLRQVVNLMRDFELTYAQLNVLEYYDLYLIILTQLGSALPDALANYYQQDSNDWSNDEKTERHAKIEIYQLVQYCEHLTPRLYLMAVTVLVEWRLLANASLSSKADSKHLDKLLHHLQDTIRMTRALLDPINGILLHHFIVAVLINEILSPPSNGTCHVPNESLDSVIVSLVRCFQGMYRLWQRIKLTPSLQLDPESVSTIPGKSREYFTAPEKQFLQELVYTPIIKLGLLESHVKLTVQQYQTMVLPTLLETIFSCSLSNSTNVSPMNFILDAIVPSFSSYCHQETFALLLETILKSTAKIEDLDLLVQRILARIFEEGTSGEQIEVGKIEVKIFENIWGQILTVFDNQKVDHASYNIIDILTIILPVLQTAATLSVPDRVLTQIVDQILEFYLDKCNDKQSNTECLSPIQFNQPTYEGPSEMMHIRAISIIVEDVRDPLVLLHSTQLPVALDKLGKNYSKTWSTMIIDRFANDAPTMITNSERLQKLLQLIRPLLLRSRKSSTDLLDATLFKKSNSSPKEGTMMYTQDVRPQFHPMGYFDEIESYICTFNLIPTDDPSLAIQLLLELWESSRMIIWNDVSPDRDVYGEWFDRITIPILVPRLLTLIKEGVSSFGEELETIYGKVARLVENLSRENVNKDFTKETNNMHHTADYEKQDVMQHSTTLAKNNWKQEYSDGLFSSVKCLAAVAESCLMNQKIMSNSETILYQLLTEMIEVFSMVQCANRRHAVELIGKSLFQSKDLIRQVDFKVLVQTLVKYSSQLLRVYSRCECLVSILSQLLLLLDNYTKEGQDNPIVTMDKEKEACVKTVDEIIPIIVSGLVTLSNSVNGLVIGGSGPKDLRKDVTNLTASEQTCGQNDQMELSKIRLQIDQAKLGIIALNARLPGFGPSMVYHTLERLQSWAHRTAKFSATTITYPDNLVHNGANLASSITTPAEDTIEQLNLAIDQVWMGWNNLDPTLKPIDSEYSSNTQVDPSKIAFTANLETTTIEATKDNGTDVDAKDEQRLSVFHSLHLDDGFS